MSHDQFIFVTAWCGLMVGVMIGVLVGIAMKESAAAKEVPHHEKPWHECPQCVKFYQDDENAAMAISRLSAVLETILARPAVALLKPELTPWLVEAKAALAMAKGE